MKNSKFVYFFAACLLSISAAHAETKLVGGQMRNLMDQPGNQKERIITIGTGAVTGVYYPAGGAICRLVNVNRKAHHTRCLVESTSGSVYNIHALQNGELDFGIVQSDWQYNAYKGNGPFAQSSPITNMRALFSLHSEMFTVAVQGKSKIRKFDQLKGKRINIGNPGSGMREIMQELMNIKGWTRADFSSIEEYNPGDAVRAFCDKEIDAMVFAAGHPNGLIQELTARCGARLLPVSGVDIDALLKRSPYYSRTVIPGGMYRGNPQNTPTFGVKATLVTTAEMDDEIVYQIVDSVFNNFSDFKTLHFVFATLEKERMVSSGLTVPLHPGAVRYYKEHGLLE